MGIVNALWKSLNKVDNTADKDKSVAQAAIPEGFVKRDTDAKWGNQDGTLITDWQSANLGDIQFRENNSQLNVLIDGIFYQNEGANPVLDSENFASYAATKDHTHDYIPLSGTKSLTGDIVPTTWCTINLGSIDYPFSAIHCWQGVFVDPTKGGGDTSYIQIIGTPMENKKCGIVFGLGNKQKRVLLTPPSQVDLSDNPEVILPNASGTIARLEDINKKITDWNTVTGSGFYYSSAGASNAPVSDAAITGNVSATGSMIVQTVYPESTDSMELVSYARKGIYNSGTITWSKWIKDSTILKTIIIKGYDGSTYTNLFNKLIPSTVTSIIFTDIKMPSDATIIDVDEDGDGGVVAWLDTNDNTKMYASTQYKGVKVEANQDSRKMFNNCTNLTSIDVSSFNTSNVTNMSSMFDNCSKLTFLNISNFDTSNVTNMNSMFNGCSKLTSLDLSNFDTSKVTTMSSMFYNCSSLTSLDVSNFDTSKVTTMNAMFYICTSLTSIDVSNFNTNNVTNMSSMFDNCSSLTSIDVSNFNTSKVTTMSSMFSNCASLTSLDLSSFDTSKVTNMNNMLYNCSKLTTIIVGDKFKWVNILDKLRLTGTWKDETGTQYTSDDTFPSNVAHTYTKVS